MCRELQPLFSVNSSPLGLQMKTPADRPTISRINTQGYANESNRETDSTEQSIRTRRDSINTPSEPGYLYVRGKSATNYGKLALWLLPSCSICALCLICSALFAGTGFLVFYFFNIPPRIKWFPVFFNYAPLHPKIIPHGSQKQIIEYKDPHMCEFFDQFVFCRSKNELNTLHSIDNKNLERKIQDKSAAINAFRLAVEEEYDSDEEMTCATDIDRHKIQQNQHPAEIVSRLSSQDHQSNTLDKSVDIAVAYIPFEGRIWEQRYQKYPINSRKSSPLGSVVGYPMNFVLKIKYEEPHMFLTPPPNGYLSWMTFQPSPIMFTIELFDKNATLVARNVRPYTPEMPYGIVQSIRRSLMLPLRLIGLPASSFMANIRLLEKFHVRTYEDMVLARVEMKPPLILKESHLSVETQLSGLKKFLRNHPIISFAVFTTVFTCIFGSVLALSCLMAYSSLLKRISSSRRF